MLREIYSGRNNLTGSRGLSGISGTIYRVLIEMSDKKTTANYADGFLPISRADMEARGWDRPDFVYVCGDAYVDHPSFGAAIITRVLEAEGFRVAFLAQPDYKSCDAFREFGRPRLGFLVSEIKIMTLSTSLVCSENAVRKCATQLGVVLRAQSCPTPCNPVACSPPGSSVHEIF